MAKVMCKPCHIDGMNEGICFGTNTTPATADLEHAKANAEAIVRALPQPRQRKN
jgi:hypothetical protein